MTRVTQMGGVDAQAQQPTQQQQGQETGQISAKKDTPGILRHGDDAQDQRKRKPTTFTDWASI